MLVKRSVRHAVTLVLLVMFLPDHYQHAKRIREVFCGSFAVYAAGSCLNAVSDWIKLVCIHAETFLTDSFCPGCLVKSFHPTSHITIMSLFQSESAGVSCNPYSRPAIVNLQSIELEVARSIRKPIKMLINNVTIKSLNRWKARTRLALALSRKDFRESVCVLRRQAKNLILKFLHISCSI